MVTMHTIRLQRFPGHYPSQVYESTHIGPEIALAVSELKTSLRSAGKRESISERKLV